MADQASSHVEFKTTTVAEFPAHDVAVDYTGTVISAEAAIKSFNLSFGPDTDQYIDKIFVTVSNVQHSTNQVTFNVDANMASEGETTSIHTGSGRGSVTVLVIANVAGSA